MKSKRAGSPWAIIPFFLKERDGMRDPYEVLGVRGALARGHQERLSASPPTSTTR